MILDNKIWLAKSQDENVCILPNMINRHGLIAGATGTGKTVTLKVLAESLSDMGVPVFLADIKGDLSGMCISGADNDGMQKRILKFGLQNYFYYHEYPTCFWDVYGENGHPLKTTISEMGPELLARLMELSPTQADVLTLIFKIAEDNSWLLIDTKDLRAMIQYVGEHAKEYNTSYGAVSKQTLGAIARNLLALETAGGDIFFGEPALDIKDWIRRSQNGSGYINILHCVKLINSPTLYATFMLWMLSELYEQMPEVGDCEKPKMVFFFDEAHLLFTDAPKALLTKIEQVIKLIRSKGIGIFFITQSPSDIPDSVLAQLGNRVQHALRAYTPSDQKAVKVAADSFRENPSFKTVDVITQLGVGEALVSFLDEQGVPGVVQQANILPPQSYMGTITQQQRSQCLSLDGMGQKYDTAIDRNSAFEILQAGSPTQQSVQVNKNPQATNTVTKTVKQESTIPKFSASSNISSKLINKTASAAGKEVGKGLVRGFFNNLKLK